MKKIIITIILSTILVANTAAQEALPYKPLSEFGADTTAFLRYNFVDRENQYIGKKMDDVINDMQIPIKSVMIDITPRFSGGIYLYVCDEKKTDYINKNNLSEIYSIGIEWEEPVASNKRLNELEVKRPMDVDEILDYFRSENRKIRAVNVFNIRDKEYYRRHAKESDLPQYTLEGDTLIIWRYH